MDAIELAEYLEDYSEYERSTDIEAAAMLRRQHEAIAELRMALIGVQNHTEKWTTPFQLAKRALKDTAQFGSKSQPAYTEDLK